jgi:hypothetical protein
MSPPIRRVSPRAGCLLPAAAFVILLAAEQVAESSVGYRVLVEALPAAGGLTLAAAGYALVGVYRLLRYGAVRPLKWTMRVALFGGATVAVLLWFFDDAVARGARERGDFALLDRLTRKDPLKGSCFTFTNRNTPFVFVGRPEEGSCEVTIRNTSSSALLLCCRYPAWPWRHLEGSGMGLFGRRRSWTYWPFGWPRETIPIPLGAIPSYVEEHEADNVLLATEDRRSNDVGLLHFLPPGRQVSYVEPSPALPYLVFWYDTSHEFNAREQRATVAFTHHRIVADSLALLWPKAGLYARNILLPVIVLEALLLFWSLHRPRSQPECAATLFEMEALPVTEEYLPAVRPALSRELARIDAEVATLHRANPSTAFIVTTYLESVKRRSETRFRTQELAVLEGYLRQRISTLEAAEQLHATEERLQSVSEHSRLQSGIAKARLLAQHVRAQNELEALDRHHHQAELAQARHEVELERERLLLERARLEHEIEVSELETRRDRLRLRTDTEVRRPSLHALRVEAKRRVDQERSKAMETMRQETGDPELLADYEEELHRSARESYRTIDTLTAEQLRDEYGFE